MELAGILTDAWYCFFEEGGGGGRLIFLMLGGLHRSCVLDRGFLMLERGDGERGGERGRGKIRGGGKGVDKTERDDRGGAVFFLRAVRMVMSTGLRFAR